MKRLILTAICLLIFLSASAQEKKLLQGFDGGMMVHTGYLQGNLDSIDYTAKGAPLGIGGVIRLHFEEHFRIGSEGYVSTLSQRGNGSYLKYGWGGLLADFYTVLDRFQPYAGISLGTYRRHKLSQARIHSRRPICGLRFHRFRSDAPDPEGRLPLRFEQIKTAPSRPADLLWFPVLSLTDVVTFL